MFIMVISKKFNEVLSKHLKRKCHDFVLDCENFKKTYNMAHIKYLSRI